MVNVFMTKEHRIYNKKSIVSPMRKLDSHMQKNEIIGVPFMAQWLTNPTRNHEVEGLIPDLAQWVGDLALP